MPVKNSSQVVVYGSYGYTGKLIVDLCKASNMEVVLAGRNEHSLKKQSEKTGYPYQVVESSDLAGLKKLLEPAALVIHCGGPFRYTAKTMSEACIATSTHYTDITGEYQVFESLPDLDKKAKELNITIMPGTGFDVVPSDCLALHLKNRLPSATHLHDEQRRTFTRHCKKHDRGPRLWWVDSHRWKADLLCYGIKSNGNRFWIIQVKNTVHSLGRYINSMEKYGHTQH
jgi:short subunit dehydrogenase-like uncharacterized protein